jgi:universal stress protein A
MKNIHSQTGTNNEPAMAEGQGESQANHRVLNPAQGEHDARNEQCHAFAPRIVLVPLTLSSSSHAALAIAKRLACESQARLVLLHVVQLNIAGEERGIQRTRLLKGLCRNAEIELQQLADSLGDQAAAQILVCEGRPAEAIVETARRLRADTIVMCAHSHRGWLKWFHRHTARQVIRQAPCRVWLVSSEQREARGNFTKADRSTINRFSEPMVFHENQNPFRSLLRVLLS